MRNTQRSQLLDGKRSKSRISKSRPVRQAQQSRHRPLQPSICRANASQIGFGDFPAELRNLVYEIALRPRSEKSIRIVQRPVGLSGQDLALGLLSSCKAVRNEAWPFLYERNNFRIDCVKLPRTIVTGGGLAYGASVVAGSSRPVFMVFDPCPKNFEADLARFIACTNHKRAFHSIRSISFAYYKSDPRRTADDQIDESHPFPEWADLILVLNLFSKRPYYSLTIDYALSTEESFHRTSRALEHTDCMVRGTFEPEVGPKKFCKTVVQEITDQLHWTCRHFSIGE